MKLSVQFIILAAIALLVIVIISIAFCGKTDLLNKEEFDQDIEAVEAVVVEEPTKEPCEPFIIKLDYDVDEVGLVFDKFFYFLDDKSWNNVLDADCAQIVDFTGWGTVDEIGDIKLKGISHEECRKETIIPKEYYLTKGESRIKLTEIIPADYTYVEDGIFYKIDDSNCLPITYEVRFMCGDDCN